MEKLREEKKKRELEGCTFRPNIRNKGKFVTSIQDVPKLEDTYNEIMERKEFSLEVKRR